MYIHIPKTGGLTVEAILISYYNFKKFTYPNQECEYPFLSEPDGKMGIYEYILQKSNEAKIYDLPSFFKFTFIRDPYKRAISSIQYLHQSTGIVCRRKGVSNVFPDNLKKFVECCDRWQSFYMHFIMSQRKCISRNGIVDMDFIGRTERLMEDLNVVLCHVLKFEKKNFDRVWINKSSDNLTLDEGKVVTLTNLMHEDDFDVFGFIKREGTPLLFDLDLAEKMALDNKI